MAPTLMWLLVSLQHCVGISCAVPAVTVARFDNAQECERVKRVMEEGRTSILRCIQAKVIP